MEEGAAPGCSAGRVQSPALRMICEREDEIARFMAQEYWTIDADVEHSAQTFPARLIEYRGEKVEQFTVTNEAQAARGRAAAIEGAARRQRSASPRSSASSAAAIPSPPFTTSTLQQEAARKLGFGAQRTMRLAQQLYEGVDFGEGAVGLITYMRTDSVNLANEAVQEIRQVIATIYGKESLAEEPRVYKTKSKNAQEAHEAIRPTSAAITPERARRQDRR